MASGPTSPVIPPSARAPLVSIGLPTYNGAHYLAEALASALAQEYAPIEVVISDDGSTDQTDAICRRFAESDPRVRYTRRARNIGAVANFRQVLAMSRGEYFTWLGQDDILSDTSYVATAVDYLERHPHVACFMTSLHILDHEWPGSRTIADLPALGPDRSAAAVRRELFAWPQTDAHYALYGMFRRADIARVSIAPMVHRGRPTSAWWEMPLLTQLSAYGRIVSIPRPLRSKRSSADADGWRTYVLASPFDLFAMDMRLKVRMIRLALTLPVPLGERVSLVRQMLGNLGRANFRRPFDLRSLIDVRRAELASLRGTAAERAELISVLEADIGKRRALLGRAADTSHECSTSPTDSSAGLDGEGLPSARLRDLERYDRHRGSPIDFFRRPPSWMLALCMELNDANGIARRLCDGQQATIERLHAQAEALLTELRAMSSAR
jgi:hypothetical protein